MSMNFWNLIGDCNIDYEALHFVNELECLDGDILLISS